MTFVTVPAGSSSPFTLPFNVTDVALPASPIEDQVFAINAGNDDYCDDQIWYFHYSTQYPYTEKWMKVGGQPLVSLPNDNLGAINPDYDVFQSPDDMPAQFVAPFTGVGTIEYWVTFNNPDVSPHEIEYGFTDDQFGSGYPVPTRIDKATLAAGETRTVPGLVLKPMAQSSQQIFTMRSVDDVLVYGGLLKGKLDMLRAA